jgi:hypothetical protein
LRSVGLGERWLCQGGAAWNRGRRGHTEQDIEES